MTAQVRKNRTLKMLQKARNPDEILLATVSGIASTKPALINFFDKRVPAIDLITTKSFQIFPNTGNREPVITEPETGSFGNSVGLKNPGMEQAVSDMKKLRDTGIHKLLAVSVSASTHEDFITLVKAFEPYADIIELNFSCPHAAAGYGASIGCDPGIAAEYMKAVRDAVGNAFGALIFPKLTPNTADIGVIAAAAAAAGADGISAINTAGPEIYREPHSGEIILNNPIGGKGGQSGNWVRERALECIRTIRKAVGPELPIIGMGGVSTGHDAAAMKRAGANVVGIGSAFGRVHQKDWPAYIESIKSGALQILADIKSEYKDKENRYLSAEPSMKYQPYSIIKRTDHTEEISIFYLDGSMKCGPGEYAFIWIPGVGEKPFSIAEQNPLTFIVKRRGYFTHELLSRSAGDVLYVRGVYGAEVEIPEKRRAVLAAGGTGIAVLPSLADTLKKRGIGMSIYYGTSSEVEQQPLLKDKLSRFGSFTAVPDAGTPGKILDVLAAQETDLSDAACFFVGPEPFMYKAAALAFGNGADKSAVMLSMERPSLCGIGMCGECACGDRLTCRYGTFVSYEFLEKNAPELLI